MSRTQVISLTVRSPSPRTLEDAVDEFIRKIGELGLEAVGVPTAIWQLSLFVDAAPDALVTGKVRKSNGTRPRRNSSRKAS